MTSREHNAPQTAHNKLLRRSALLAPLVGAAVFLSSCATDNAKGSPDQEHGNPGTTPTATAELVPGVTPNPADLANYNGTTQAQRDKMSVGDYLNLPEAVRAADDAEAFNKHLQGAYDALKQQLTDEEKQVFYMPDLNKPRKDWSDQDYLNYHSLMVYLATSQKIANPNDPASVKATTDEELRELMVVAFPGSAPDPSQNISYEYSFLSHQVQSQPGVPIKDIDRAMPKSPNHPLSGIELTNVQIGQTYLDNNGGRVVVFENISNPTPGQQDDVIVYKNYAGPKGDIVTTDEHVYYSMVNDDLKPVVAKYGQSNP